MPNKKHRNKRDSGCEAGLTPVTISCSYLSKPPVTAPPPCVEYTSQPQSGQQGPTVCGVNVDGTGASRVTGKWNGKPFGGGGICCYKPQ